MTLKPEVCWQLPLRREDQVDDDEGHVTSVIRQWDRRHWGKGGREFHWWCTEAPDAFVGSQARLRGDAGRAHQDGRAKVYDRFVALVTRSATELRPPGVRSLAASGRCGAAQHGGSARRRQLGTERRRRKRG